MSAEYFTVEVSNKLAVITLRRPEKKNAINGAMYIGLAKALDELSARDDVSITALTSTGDFYSSGNDLGSVFAEAQKSSDMDATIDSSTARVRNLVDAFISHSKVLVAVVNGPAVGIAVTTLALCDIVYCTPEAWFQTPFTKLGLCAEAASSYTFPKIMGVSKAGEMLYLNKKMSAAEAAAVGFVARVVPRDALEKEVWEPLRQNAAQLSPLSLSATKRLIRQFDANILHEANRAECRQLGAMFRSEEAMAALVQFASRSGKSKL